jgi:ElaB/YqjD/DUF883 family membrane-anchored ribosome-binding protein
MPTTDGVTGQAQDKAQDVAGQAKQQASQVTGQAKEQLRTQVDQRSTQAGESVSSQASDLRTVAEQLREQGKDKPARVAEQAADRIERVGRYLKESDPDRILSDVEDFARQRPWVVVAGGAALGFMASRFLKASQSERYGARPQQRSTYATGPAAVTPAPARGATTGNELSSGVGATGSPDLAPGFGAPPTRTTGGL